MASFYNQNQILAVRLIADEQLYFSQGGKPVPYKQVFNHRAYIEKKMLSVAYYDGKAFHSITDGAILTSTDAVMESEDAGIRLIFDPDTISLKSSGKKTRSGVLYTNVLKYSLPKMSEDEADDLQRQLDALRSGKAYHLLMQFYDCTKAYGMVLCPYPQAFSVEVEDNIENASVSIAIANLSSHQWIR